MSDTSEKHAANISEKHADTLLGAWPGPLPQLLVLPFSVFATRYGGRACRINGRSQQSRRAAVPAEIRQATLNPGTNPAGPAGSTGT
jgi:hypothetical protein